MNISDHTIPKKERNKQKSLYRVVRIDVVTLSLFFIG